MDGDPAFGAGAADVVDVDALLLRLAQRRLRGVVPLRPAETPALTQLHGFVGRGHAEVFGLVGCRGADLLGDDLGDLLGDPAASESLTAVVTVPCFAVAVAATTAATGAPRPRLSQPADGTGSLTEPANRLSGPFADLADRLARAFADLADGFASATANVLNRAAGAFADVLDGTLGPFADVLHRAPSAFADLADRFSGAFADRFERVRDALQHLGVAVERGQHPVDDRGHMIEPRPQQGLSFDSFDVQLH